MLPYNAIGKIILAIRLIFYNFVSLRMGRYTVLENRQFDEN